VPLPSTFASFATGVPDPAFGDKAAHRFIGDDDGVRVRRVQPDEATKPYRCAGCDHEIGIGIGDVVVVPRQAMGDRRHWHRSCWERASRGAARPRRRRV
jgi:hypothetical protein